MRENEVTSHEENSLFAHKYVSLRVHVNYLIYFMPFWTININKLLNK